MYPMKNHIELQKHRGFSDVFSAVFDFVFKNFKSLFKYQLTVPLPLILFGIGCIIYGYSSIFNQMGNIGPYGNNNPFGSQFIIFLVLGMITLMIGAGLMVPIYYAQVIFYKEGKSKVTFNELWEVAKQFIGKTIGVYVLLFLLSVVALVIIGGLITLLVMISPIFVIFVVFLYIGLLLAIVGFLPAILPAMFFEDLSAVNAIGRGLSIGKRSFWFFVGVGIVMSMAVGFSTSIINYASMIPAFVVAFTSTATTGGPPEFAPWTFFVILFPMTFTVIVQHIFYHTTSVFLYFSSVEKYEAKGLESKIDEINETNI